MSAKDHEKAIPIQAKLFDFALTELVQQHKETFQPLWTLESWAKFLIWLALNCGLSGEKQSLEFFAEALGNRLSSRMRRIFFERTLEKIQLKIIADPADTEVLIMSMEVGKALLEADVAKALDQVGLIDLVVEDRNCWKSLNEVIAIPWQVSSSEE